MVWGYFFKGSSMVYVVEKKRTKGRNGVYGSCFLDWFCKSLIFGPQEYQGFDPDGLFQWSLGLEVSKKESEKGHG